MSTPQPIDSIPSEDQAIIFPTIAELSADSQWGSGKGKGSGNSYRKL